MKSVKVRSYVTVAQIIILLLLASGFVWYQKAAVLKFFQTTQTGQMGLILNSLIILLFLFGLVRIVWVFFSYAREQGVLSQFVGRMRDKVANPTYQLAGESMIVGRYYAIQRINQQNATVEQGALAATLAATQSSRFTLIRFVHNTLILAGVFGTIVSLSVALVGAAGLLESPDSLDKMGTIIGGMSTALSTTITAILCYVFYTYFHLCLQDARTQLLANIEEVTALYIMPQFATIEENVLRDVTQLTADLRYAAESVRKVQERFLLTGERLQLAVDDLQSSMSQLGDGSRDMNRVIDTLREGFRLEPQQDQPASQEHDAEDRESGASKPWITHQ